VQCCVKYGTPEQRDLIAKELSGHYARLSQSKYAKFIVSRILQYCTHYRQAVMADFHGKVKKLIRHKEASVILDEAYSQYANSAQRMSLMEEFYGPEFAIFKSV
jgi:pumilio homology domain family member 6